MRRNNPYSSVTTPFDEGGPSSISLGFAEMATSANEVEVEVERLGVRDPCALRAIRIIVATDEADPRPRRGREGRRTQGGGRHEVRYGRPECARTGRRDKQNAFDLLLARGTYSMVEPKKAAERVSDYNPLGTAELHQLRGEQLEPSFESRLIWVGKLRIEDNLAVRAQLLGEVVLPMTWRPPVFDTVDDQRPPPGHRVVRCAGRVR